MGAMAPKKAEPLMFDVFWKWLTDHPNCLMRVMSGDMTVQDNELLHWDIFDEDGRAVVQMIQGKTLVAEMVIDRAQVKFVQAYPDPEEAASGQWMFECISGSDGEESFPLFGFVMAHGMDQMQGHAQLKH